MVDVRGAEETSNHHYTLRFTVNFRPSSDRLTYLRQALSFLIDRQQSLLDFSKGLRKECGDIRSARTELGH
jgi:hypothetical protein